MIPDYLLRELFGLKTNCGGKSCDLLSEIIKSFTLYLSSQTSEYHQLSSIISGENENFRLKWLPEHCCVLLMVNNVPRSVVSLQLIVLDEWTHDVRSDVATGRELIATSEHYCSVSVGEISFSLYDTFMEEFNARILAAKKKMNVLRVLYDTFKQLDPSHVPPKMISEFFSCSIEMDTRGVSWCLVRAVIGALVMNYPHLCSGGEESAHSSFKMLTLDFYIWILESYSPCSASVETIDLTMSVLSYICKEISMLAHSDCIVGKFEERCRLIRSRLESDACRSDSKMNWDLQEIMSSTCRKETRISEGGWANFTVKLPQPTATLLTIAESLTDCSKRINENLCALLSIPDRATCTTEEMIAWIQGIDKEIQCRLILETEGRQLVLSSVHKWLFKKLENIGSLDSLISVQRLKDLLDQYRSHSLSLTALLKAKSIICIELRSMEVLSTWIIFCFIHTCAKRLYPIIESYDVPLKSKDLRHLSLADKAAVDAALAVCAYIDRYTSSKNCLFSLSNQTPTMQLARMYSEGSILIGGIWSREQKAASEKQDAHWGQVRRLQAKAVELRSQIITLKVDLRDLIRGKSEMEEGSGRYNCRYNDNEIEFVERVISQRSRALAEAERPLPLVHQSLPKDKGVAMIILFFLYMPDELHTYSTLCLIAQQMLLPLRASFSSQEELNLFKSVTDLVAQPSLDSSSSWSSYYIRESKSPCPKISNNVMIQYTDSVPTTLNYKHIDHYIRPEDGIWYPDSLQPIMTWKGGEFQQDNYLSGKYFNPFINSSTIDTARVHSFTVPVSSTSKNLFQYSLQSGSKTTAPSRGNQGICFVGTKPEWLNKPQFLAFTGIRAYPHLQLRKICAALRDHSLPLGRPEILILFKQALYHLGDLESDAEYGIDEEVQRKLFWRGDGEEGYLMLHRELEDLVELLGESPKDHMTMHLLGEIATFLAEWHPPSRDLTRKISEIIYRWARDSQEKLETMMLTDSMDANQICDERGKQFVFYVYSLLCHRMGFLTPDDIERIVLLSVIARNVGDYSHSEMFGGLTEQLKIEMQGMMTGISARLVPISQIALTRAVRAVVNEPRDLVFEEMKGSLLCYEARIVCGVTMDRISINVISGVVLYNGLPPRSLPISIRSHSMYRRSFGNRDFEIILKGNILRTVRPVLGCIYEFTSPEVQGGALLIREIHVLPNGDETGLVLELLDGVTSGGWKEELPVRLQELHSHWYSRELQTIFLRPKSFLRREIDFFIKKSISNSKLTATSWICHSVPSNYREFLVKDLLETFKDNPNSFRRLIVFNPHLVHTIFGKIEDTRFIHSYITGKDTFLFSLPRFGLEFEARIDGLVMSLDFAGYHLAKCQQLSGTLMNFNQYLLLEDDCGQIKLVTQSSVVSFNSQKNIVTVASDPTCGTPCLYYIYGVHPRFKYLMANSIADGLHLVALYAASSSFLPEPRTGMTGDEVAISILRHQWVNRPLNEEELTHLMNVLQFCNRAPALSLLCQDLYESSQKLSFLHSSTISPMSLTYDSYAATEYEKSRMFCSSCRTSLTNDEEERILTWRTKCVQNRSVGNFGHLDYHCSSKTSEFLNIVKKTEKELISLLRKSASKIASAPFPLRESNSDIGKKMMSDLSDSWTEFNSLTVLRILPKNKEFIVLTLERKLRKVRDKRKYIEDRLLLVINTLPSEDRWDLTTARLNKITNILPSVTILDFVSIADKPAHLLNFNPFFSKNACDNIWLDIITWMTLCVLEDRLCRAVHIGRDSSNVMGNEELVRELSVYRNWSAVDHPKWLIFEVEGSLQIRPSQYDIARTLIQNEGAIAQLNMGEGKTRVILPMLILHWGSEKDSVLRLYFLSQLLKEAYAHLHRYLSSSILGCKIFLMPFNRDVRLTPEMVKIMHSSLMFCQKSNGCLIMAREHRLSLHLKSYELEASETASSEATRAALKVLNDVKYVDMLDESEELLNYRTQLMYAVGDPVDIPGGAIRWIVTQAALRALKVDPTVRDILKRPNVSLHDTAGHNNTSETFPKIRLLAGEALDAVKMDLLIAIARYVLTEPPYEMRWLRLVKKKIIEGIVSFVTNSAELDENLLAFGTCKEHRDDILALRGLLAFGNLFHCLEKVHRVNYGVNRINGKKRIAVPYRASDIPCERAEFAYPDVGIVFTYLSYYSDGLSREQFSETLSTLFGLGVSEQAKVYGEWYELSRGSMTEEDKIKVDNVRKLDHTSSSQYELLYNICKHNVATVSAWLDWLVFPLESMQFPEKLTANAWNLVDNPTNQARGFSGTDDKKLLLPLQVHSHRTDEPEGARILRGTNGKMLQFLLKYSHYEKMDVSIISERVSDISVPGDYEKPLWQLVVNHAMAINCSAIIDPGALMVGASNLDVALHVLSKLPRTDNNSSCDIKGVLFFNTTANVNDWQIRDAEGREWPRHSSPIKESECFVLFDESRCIGSDVKMKQDATCLLTLGTGMCKDKLMQAAGRARMLGRGQTLVLLGTRDISEKINGSKALSLATATESESESEAISVVDVINWVMSNTIAATEDGLLLWAEQGRRFCVTEGDRPPLPAMQNVSLSLDDLYYHEQLPEVAVDIHERGCVELQNRCKKRPFSEVNKHLWKKMKKHVKLYGDFEVLQTEVDGECEKEIEKEIIREQIVETKLLLQTPKDEIDWKYDRIMKYNSENIRVDTNAISLEDAIKEYINPVHSLQSIPWSRSELPIYCTRNFIETICKTFTNRFTEEYLRPVDMLLCFPNLILLISEREANGIIPYMQKVTVDKIDAMPCLIHLTYAKEALESPPSAWGPLCSEAKGPTSFHPKPLGANVTAILQLFNGETTFGKKSKAALSKLLSTIESRKAAQLIPRMRGLGFMLSRSDLEEVCIF